MYLVKENYESHELCVLQSHSIKLCKILLLWKIIIKLKFNFDFQHELCRRNEIVKNFFFGQIFILDAMKIVN